MGPEARAPWCSSIRARMEDSPPTPFNGTVRGMPTPTGKPAVEHPAAVQRIEGIGIPSAAFVDQAVYIRTVRAGLSGEVVKQAIDAIGHRDFFVRRPCRKRP